MDIYLKILVFLIFAGATILHYRKPSGIVVGDDIWKKIPEFSRMKRGVLYDPRQAHELVAYHISTFGERMRGEMLSREPTGYSIGIDYEKMMEKAAFKLHDNDEAFFILYWWRNRPQGADLYTFNNKQDFLDEIYNHWGAELYSQLSENFGCETQPTTT